MWDVIITTGTVYSHSLSPNRTLAGLAIRGDGSYLVDTSQSNSFEHKDFIIVQSGQGAEVAIQAKNQELRIFLIEIPTEVDYPLYRKPR
ncbi:hypothetical protein PP175_04150 [Aneurinibacillus sp. Ricciae_BoGa-3]|uniref:hypothetical protein n=1 Tax=Aneurinibacillus sp. Ricciae_BoGa-3 TaxID=3022697 RepID=UPI00234098B3|nr:hypothetical protein [Aneurinibacillus sp. Ricciae_BoGa-3]WCK55187.1 hypothetical protein PP175_04150 [Aneurinibacillus sp. Ricciae_BoGa-3]